MLLELEILLNGDNMFKLAMLNCQWRDSCGEEFGSGASDG